MKKALLLSIFALLSITMNCTVSTASQKETEEIAGVEFDVKEDIEFMGDVPNDVTGKWKWSRTIKSADPYDYAIAYCKEYCSDDDEIHAVINLEDDTTTCLNYTADNGASVSISVHQYVPDEEKDAKILFTGEVLKERVIDIDTGFYFDYDTGETGYYDVPETIENADSEYNITYVLNTNTKKFHVTTCNSVDDIKESNRQDFSGTREEAISMGYDPCGRCKP